MSNGLLSRFAKPLLWAFTIEKLRTKARRRYLIIIVLDDEYTI
jgi:hypothetical protein